MKPGEREIRILMNSSVGKFCCYHAFEGLQWAHYDASPNLNDNAYTLQFLIRNIHLSPTASLSSVLA